MHPFEKFCEDMQVAISVKYGTRKPIPVWFQDANAYTVTLTYRTRQLTVPFFQGTGIKEDPSVASVLHCLLSDASMVESVWSFEDWAEDLGFDSDSIKARNTYDLCVKNTIKLRKLLGDDFTAFVDASADY